MKSLMERRREIMLFMANMDIIPSYLKHIKFTPSENTRTMSLSVGADFHGMVLTSTCPDTPSAITVKNGVFNYDSNAFIPGCSRIIVKKTNGTYDYYAPNSSGGQSWTYSDGVVTIGNETAFWFGAGVQYDAFYW